MATSSSPTRPAVRVVFYPSLYETSVVLGADDPLLPSNSQLEAILQRAAASWPIGRAGKKGDQGKTDAEAAAATAPWQWSISLCDNDAPVARDYAKNAATFAPVVHKIPLDKLKGLEFGDSPSAFVLLGDRIEPFCVVFWAHVAFRLTESPSTLDPKKAGTIGVWMRDLRREGNLVISRKTVCYSTASLNSPWKRAIEATHLAVLDTSELTHSMEAIAPDAKRSKVDGRLADLADLGPTPNRNSLAKLLTSALADYIAEAKQLAVAGSEYFDGVLATSFSELYRWTASAKPAKQTNASAAAAAVTATPAAAVPDDLDAKQLVNRFVVFALLLYPYWYYSHLLMEVGAARWLPRSIKALAAALDDKHPLPSVFGYWTTLAIHAFLEQVIFPVIGTSLTQLKQLTDSLTVPRQDSAAEGLSQRLVRYVTARDAAIMHFGDNIYEVLKRLSTGNPASKLLHLPFLNRSLEQPDDRPFLFDLLVPLSIQMRSIVLENPAAAANPRLGAGAHKPMVAAILDIEDLAPERAPHCIRERMNLFMDPTGPFGHETRLVFLPEHEATIATLLGVGPMGNEQFVTCVPNQDNRSQVYAYVMNLLERLNQERAENIRMRRKVGTHDYGPVMKAMLDGFVRNASGVIYSRKCACATNANDEQTCFYLDKNKKDKRGALAECHASLGLSDITAAVHPAELFAASVALHKTRRNLGSYKAGVAKQ